MKISNKLINFLRANNLNELLDLKSKTFSKNDITAWLEQSNEVLSFMIRYTNPILQEIINKKLVSDDFVLKHKHELDKLGIRWYAQDFEKQNGYFRVVIVPNFDYPDKERITKEEIKNSFLTIPSKSLNALFVKLSELEKFLDKYADSKLVRVEDNYGSTSSHISINKEVEWNNELITRYKNFWHWGDLHRNTSIDWNFELIKSNRDKLNWAYICSYDSLFWNIDKIKEFEDYIIFSARRKRNRNGEYHEIYIHSRTQKETNYYCGSLSLSNSVEWSKELINKFAHLWDWSELCLNNSAPWNIDLINYYIDKIDFDSLSRNTGIKWSTKLINYFIDKWNWEYLSANSSLPWNEELIERFEKHWIWRAGEISFKDIDKDYFSVYCLSANEGINWSDSLIEKYNSQVDFWLISRYGKLDIDTLERFHNSFNEKRVVDREYHKWSDFGSELVDVLRTGWENLAFNSNFHITPQNIEYLYSTYVEITEIYGNFVHHGNYRSIKKSLLEIVKDNEIIDFKIDEIINNELSWADVLINEDFVNDSLLKKYFKNYMTEFLNVSMS